MFISWIVCRQPFRSAAWILGRLPSSLWTVLAWVADIPSEDSEGSWCEMLCSQASTSHIILFYFAFRCLMTLILVTITFPPFTCHKEGSLMRMGTTFVLHLFHCHKISIPDFLCVAGSVHKDLLLKWHHNCIPKHPLRHLVIIVVDPLWGRHHCEWSEVSAF